MTLCLSVFAFSALTTGCVEEMELVEELNLSACLTPSSTSMNIDRTDGTTVTFTWANSKGATQYEIEIFEGDELDEAETVFAGNPVKTEHVTAAASGSTTSAKIKLDADKFYFARVKAQHFDSDGVTKVTDDSRWAIFPYPIATYVVKSSVSDIKVVERTSTSVKISWQMPEGDSEVNQIRVTPNPDPNSQRAYGVYELESEVTPGAAVEFTVGTDELPLLPSKCYTFAIHYGSANRGEIVAWTRPDWSKAQEAADTATFRMLLNEAGIPAEGTDAAEPKQIKLTNTDVDYVMGTMDIIGPVEIFGEQTPSGDSPVVIGTFNLRPSESDYVYYTLASSDSGSGDVYEANTIPQTLGGTYLRVEALDLQGTKDEDYLSEVCVNINDAEFAETDLLTVQVVNCDISDYDKSAIYHNKLANFAEVLFDGCFFENMGTSQDGFDFRTEGTIGSFTIRNSTLANGFRSMVRVDKGTLNSLVFDNNTLYNVGDPSNKGIFYVRSAVGSFELTDNLFMEIDLALVFGDKNTTLEPSKISSNFFYKIGETAWAPEENGDNTVNEGGLGALTESKAISGGGAVLSSDPCENSARGIYNVTNALVLDAGAGDPRWLVDYVAEPVPDLEPTEYNTVWDLTDTDIFYEEIEDSTVRGNIEFFIIDNPIRVTDNGFEFTAEAALSSSGTPSDCAMAFLVDGPGSVVISALQSRSGSTNDHISVAYGPADGSSAKVAGSAFAGAEGTKIAFPNFVSGTQQLIYVYACGPIVLNALSWIESTDVGETPKLATPVLSIDNPDVDDTFEGNVTVSWPSVPYADRYEVKVNGEANTVAADADAENMTYIFTPSSMIPGTYTVTVQALKADNDPSRENSDVSDPVTLTISETLKPVSQSVPTTWGAEDFGYLFETKSGGSKDTEVKDDFVYNNLYYLNGGGKCKFGEDTNAAGEKAYRYQFGGTGSTEKQTLQFIVSGNGTLTIEAASSGSTDRYVGVSVGQTQIVEDTELMVPGTGADAKKAQIFNLKVTANSGDYISIYSLGSGINLFSITWTPEGYDPDATIPSDPLAVEEQKDVIDYLRTTYGTSGTTALVAAGADPVTIDKITYAGKSDKSIDWDGGNERIKLQGASEVGDDGLPTSNYISFKVTGPGTIKHYLRSGNSGDTGRTVKIDLVMNDGANIVNLYEAAAPTGGYSSNEVSTQITSEQLAQTRQTATVYIYAPVNSVNVYYLEYIPD